MHDRDGPRSVEEERGDRGLRGIQEGGGEGAGRSSEIG